MTLTPGGIYNQKSYGRTVLRLFSFVRLIASSINRWTFRFSSSSASAATMQPAFLMIFLALLATIKLSVAASSCFSIRLILLLAILSGFRGLSIQIQSKNPGFASRTRLESGFMRVGVTGGAGYIGSHTVHALIAARHEVVIVDDFSTGDRTNLQPGASLIEGRFQEPAVLAKFFDSGLDAVFHFAALKAAGESMNKPEDYAEANVRGSLLLIESASRRGVRNFVFSSSAAVYGEPRYLPVDENHPLEPINYYGFTKKCVEENLGWFSKLNRMRYASLRYFNAAGYARSGRIRGLERDTANLLPLVMRAAAGDLPYIELFGRDYQTRDGTCIRDYVHVEDLADAHVRALDYIARNDLDLTVNLGSENGMTVMEMVETAREITGREIVIKESPRRVGDPPSLIASSARAHDLLGWSARYSDARTIIESMWNVYRDIV